MKKYFKGKKIEVGNKYKTNKDFIVTLQKIENDKIFFFCVDDMKGDFFDQPTITSSHDTFNKVVLSFFDETPFALCEIEDNIISLKDKIENL